MNEDLTVISKALESVSINYIYMHTALTRREYYQMLFMIRMGHASL